MYESCSVLRAGKSVVLSHNAALGCNKCLKRFNVQIEVATDFSGYDRDNWESRTREQHCRYVEKVMKEVTKTGIQSAKSHVGVRFFYFVSFTVFRSCPLYCHRCNAQSILGNQ